MLIVLVYVIISIENRIVDRIVDKMKEFLNKSSSIPLYFQVKEMLKDKIKRGDWEEDEKIPNEIELTKLFDVSRSTIRQAVLELVNEGLLKRIKGCGTFVEKVRYEGDFMSFSYPHELGKKHVPISTTVINGPLEYLHIFKLYNSKKINEMIRLRYFKGEPAVIERTYLPFYLFPDILDKDMEQPIYDIIKNDYKITIINHKVNIEPIILSDYEASLLGVSTGKPALKTTKICETSNNLPILLTESIFREDRCKFFFKYENF